MKGEVEKLSVEVMLLLLLQRKVLVLIHRWQQWTRSAKPVPWVVEVWRRPIRWQGRVQTLLLLAITSLRWIFLPICGWGLVVQLKRGCVVDIRLR